MLLPVVDYTPGIARIRVAALQLPMLRLAAQSFEAIDVTAFIVGPIRSRARSQSHHAAETWIGVAGSRACSGAAVDLQRLRSFLYGTDGGHDWSGQLPAQIEDLRRKIAKP